MKEEIRKEILYDITQTLKILNVREVRDVEELKGLSDHAIEDVALHKDLDVISVTVLIYSLYKVVQLLSEVDYLRIVRELQQAQKMLQQLNYNGYNQSMRRLYHLVDTGNEKVREHLQDVMQAARIKKGTVLLEKGLSIGQAAGLMGLSNWDLQQYAAKTTALEIHTEGMNVEMRLQKAFSIFGVR